MVYIYIYFKNCKFLYILVSNFFEVLNNNSFVPRLYEDTSFVFLFTHFEDDIINNSAYNFFIGFQDINFGILVFQFEFEVIQNHFLKYFAFFLKIYRFSISNYGVFILSRELFEFSVKEFRSLQLFLFLLRNFLEERKLFSLSPGLNINFGLENLSFSSFNFENHIDSRN